MVRILAGDTYAIEAVTGDVHADPQPPPTADLGTGVGAVEVGSVGPPLFWVGAGALLVGVLLVLRRRRRAGA
jgi:LPXTG-motif cell wall-anchored protein